MIKVVAVVLVFIGVSTAVPPYGATGHGGYGYDDHYSPAYYSYGYVVKDPYTYSDFGHEESRAGDTTKGQYQVLLPDGRRQIVTYYVNGHSGYVADVKYVGEAKYDHPKPAYGGAYKQY